MRTIETYISRQLRLPVVGAIVSLTGVALLSQSLSQFDAVIGHGQNALALFKVTFYSLPQLLVLILPLGLMVGSLVGLNRMHNEQEFVACFTSGMSLSDVSRPVIRMAVVVALFSLFLNLFVEPFGSRLMRQELYRIRTDALSSLIRDGEFSTSDSGLTIYVQKIEQNGLLREIFIRTPNSVPVAGAPYRPRDDWTYSAREGRIVNKDGHSILILRHGSTQHVSDKEILVHSTFQEYSFDITDYFVNNDFLHFKESDRYLHELLFPNTSLDWEHGNWKKLLAEGHIRLSSPLYNIAFVLMALIGVLGGGFSRHGYGNRIGIVLAVASGVRIIGIGLEALCGNVPILNLMLYVVPLGVILIAYRMILRVDNSMGSGSRSGRMTSLKEVAQ